MFARDINRRLEYFIYIFFWGAFMLAPFSDYILSGGNRDIEWENVYRFWLFLLPIFILFLINNYLLLPILIKKKRYTLYLVLALSSLFLAYLIFSVYTLPDKPKHIHPQYINGEKHFLPPMPKHNHLNKGQKPNIEVTYKYKLARRSIHDIYVTKKVYTIEPERREIQRYLDFILRPHVAMLVFMIFTIVFNGFVKIYFAQIRNDRRALELERQMLTTELQYLKFQINPHFFMNTLNNIHALIGVDRQKAQKSVINLSKMMRYMLYETQNIFVPLDKEIAFMQGFIELMCLRYNENLVIRVNFPVEAYNVNVPSSLFISFLENAFKHGVEQGQESVIEVTMNIADNEIVFKCNNSIASHTTSNTKDAAHGVGLKNTIKRLQLLYGDNFTLKIDSDYKYYNVLLKIPINYDEMCYCR